MKAKKNIPKIDAQLTEPGGHPAAKKLIKSPNHFPVVGIGASAGGLDAFKKLLKAIPEDSGMAYVLVQHLDPNHESLLPEILQKITNIPVLEIADDIKVLPDHIYVIPSNKMMVATDGILQLAPRPAKNNTQRNLPIDLFFASLAEVHQEHAIGVVLSGTASDGTQGLKAIKEHGGITFAQDEASAEYESMPHSAVQAGVVDFILPPGEIPKKLLEITSKIKLSDEELQNIPKQDEDVFRQILSLLRIRKGVDFTYYKQTTVRRRILRRMLVNKNEGPDEYLKFLRTNNPEQDLLYQDMLIPVTSFFRDKKTFDNLCNHVFPTILKSKIPGEITRIWVAGCSTGQEVYSFAICFKEFLGEHHEKLQIFGTDLSEPAIIKARTGLYEKNEVDSVSPQRLKEYFTKNNGGYQVNKSIRDMCVFAHHNFLKDPPFGKMDCISCRNVLIYMEPYLQKKALITFHYALNPKGFLLLGKSETTGGVPDLFAAVEKNDKLYTRKDVPGRFMQVASLRSEQILNRTPDSVKSETIRTDFQKTADDILLTKYTPAGVVVNETMDIVHFRGNTANYLEQAPGKPSHNLLMMAKHGLGFELRNILHKAKTDKAPVVKENIPLSVNGNLRNISIEAVPLPNTLEPYYLILFHDSNLNDSDGSAISNRKKVSAKTKKDEKDIQIQLLEQELAQAREDMRSITEDQEASNEELQSANEELLSGSEELQSLNEELETSKEELQSTNEELTVLNHELIGLNEQITDARNYNESIVATLYQPLLVLDKHLRVKTANKAFYKTFKVNEQETEGVLIYDLGNRQWNIPELRTLLEEVLPQKKQITDYEVTHNFSSIGIRTILLCALEITREKKEEKLILLSIEDVTEKASAQKKIKESEHRFHELVRSSPSLISICKGEDMIIEIANDAILESWGKGNIIGQSVFDAIPESVEQGFDKLLLSVYKTGVPVQANEVPVTLLRKGIKELVYYNLIYQPQRNVDDEIEGVAIISTEVTPQAEFNLKIKASEEQLRSLVMQAPVAICIFKGRDFIVEVANKGFLQIVGKAENEYVGKPVFDSVPETRSTAEPLLLQVLNTGVPYFGNELENTITRFGKTEKGFFNFVFQPILGNDGTATGIMVVANEVTEQVHARKKVEESEAKYRSLFDTMDQGFCIVEVLFDEHNNPIDYLFVEVNPVFEEQSGLKNAAGKTILELVPDLEKRWFNIYGKVVTTGESIRFIEGSDAMGRMFDVYAFKVGEVESRRIAILFTDITEQKRTEKNLIESEERFRSLVMATSNTVYKMSADWKVMYNLEGKDFLADTTDSSISWLQKYIPESERTLVIKTIEEAIAHKKIFELEHQVFDADGNIAWTYSRAVPKINEKGEIIEWTGAASNITERKRAEQTLVESEQRFRSLVEKSPNPICIFKGTQMTLELANEPMLKIFSAGEEALGKPYLEILPEMKEQPFMALLLDVLQNGVTHYGTEQPAYFVRQNGEKETYYFNFVYQPYHENDGSVSGVMVLATDVTEQVLARKKVELQNQLFSDMLMTAPGFVATLAGPDHVYELVNEKYQSLFGKREIKGKAIMEALPELEGQGFDTLLDNVYNTGEPYVGINIPITLARDEGLAPEERYFNFSYQPMYDEYKNIFSILVFGYEVTAQVIATKKIEESESFNRAVLESSPDCIKMLDADGRLQFMNSNGICLLELDDFEQVQNTYWWDMWEPDNRQIIKDAVETAKSGEKIQLQLFGPTAKGTPKWWDIIVLPVQEDGTDKNLHRILSVSRDITKQKLNELKEKELLTRFQNLVLQAPVAICVLRGQNYVIEVINKGMYEMWDRTLEQALNKPAFEVLPELMEQGFKELLDNVYKTGERFVADELPINLKRNGKIENAFVKFVYEPLKDADGTISGVMALAHEITGEVLSRKKIEESEIKFRSLIEEAPVATCMFTGREMKIEVANDIMIGYWGKGKSVIGKPLAVAVPELKGQPFLKILDEVFTTGKTYHSNNARAELELDGLLGTYYFDFTYKPIFNAVGEVYGIMDMAVDVTEQVIASKKIEESEAHFRQLADLMPAKISNANVDGEVTYFNKSWLDFSGFNFEELRDFGYHQIIHPDELEEFQTRFQNATVTLTDLVMEMRFKNKAGDYVWHLNIASPVKDENGKHKMWIGVTTDISEQIKIREGNLVIYETYAKELREAKELAELATVIAEAAKDNAEKAAAIAEEAVKSKQQFLSNMSHEIRTPMNAIIGFSKVVLKTDLTEKQKEYLTAIKISGDALIVLINDILDLAKVDSGKLTFEQIPFKLADSIKVMMHLFEPKVQEKNIELVKEYDNKIPAVLVGDPVRLHQIILNLLSNAVKFTNQGKITVNVSLLNEDEEKVTVAFAVSDTGIGIPQDKIASIFENFQQASADTTRLYGGTGLGLAISKQLVTMQGGNITVKSKVGEGAVFSFTLSFKKTTARVEAAAEIIKIAAQIKNIKVLVVEDVALNQLLVKTLLEDFGFDCDICANGKLAIEKLHTGAYDIILMDLQMPEMNGFEATEYIRHTMHSAIPIIALTADVTTADVAKCKAVGMDDYISKPVDEKLLYSKIIKLMEKPGTVEEIIAAIKYTNLEYLQKHTKSNPKLMMEMIQLYLEQTPPLINTIKQSLAGKNWELLQSAVHKMIPSFSIVGMNPDFTAMAKKIQQYSIAPEVNDEVHDLVLQLEKACGQACIEMEEAYNSIKNTNS